MTLQELNNQIHAVRDQSEMASKLTSFKNNIKTNDIQTARMILDTKSKTVEKNGFPEDITYDKAYEYLKKHYPKYFVDA